MSAEQGTKQLADLVMTCALACLAGQPTVTVSATGKRPAGFPRGELLSVNSEGAKNVAVCPVKVLAWIHTRARARTDAQPSPRST